MLSGGVNKLYLSPQYQDANGLQRISSSVSKAVSRGRLGAPLAHNGHALFTKDDNFFAGISFELFFISTNSFGEIGATGEATAIK